jgi:protease I
MFEKIEKIFKKDSTDEVVEGPLRGTQVAILATDGFEQSELFDPKEALEAHGATVKIVSLKPGSIKAWKEDNWGKTIAVDLTVLDAFSQEFDYLMLPGGVLNPDKLRKDTNAIAFIQTFINAGKPIAAICHGGQTLIETGFLKGKNMTSYEAVKTDMINAGAKWVDKDVVVDGYFVTSRKPTDIPVFNREMTRVFTEYHTRHSLPNTESYVVTL